MIFRFMWFYCEMQNGTLEEVKKIVAMLNEGAVPSPDVVGMSYQVIHMLYMSIFWDNYYHNCFVCYNCIDIFISFTTHLGDLGLCLYFT